MSDTVFVPGMATAIGSLPHRDAGAAAALVLRCLPELPAAPQLPIRTPLEGFVAQWARAIDGVEIEADGALDLAAGLDSHAEIVPIFDAAGPRRSPRVPRRRRARCRPRRDA